MLKFNIYIKNLILIDKFLEDTGNEYTFVSQRPYKGKTDINGNTLVESGAVVTLQVRTDKNEPTVDKNGNTIDNNVMEMFEATIVGVKFPLQLKKGCIVRLDGFLPDISYYINHTPILRFESIEEVKAD